MKKIGKNSSIVTQTENVSSNHLMAQIHFVRKLTTYTTTMVQALKAYACLHNVLMMLLVLQWETHVHPEPFTELVLMDNAFTTQ